MNFEQNSEVEENKRLAFEQKLVFILSKANFEFSCFRNQNFVLFINQNNNKAQEFTIE